VQNSCEMAIWIDHAALTRHSVTLSPRPPPSTSRLPPPTRTQWQRLRIKFEHRSRNFRAHHHGPAACDLIVCWHHDWAECPLEVLELSEAVRRLKSER
jgi:hypothetical protein